MREVNTQFINHVIEQSDKQQREYGSMQKTYYHRHYLAQEALTRLEYFQEKRGKNKANAVDKLVMAAASVMGEFSKNTGYDKSIDVNATFLTHLTDEVDRLTKEKKNKRAGEDLIGEAIEELLTYCNKMPIREKTKERRLLIKTASLIMMQYNKETR